MKPPELTQAEMVAAMCQRFHVLPWPGSLLEQPAIAFLQWQSILNAGSTTASTAAPEDALADLMVPL